MGRGGVALAALAVALAGAGSLPGAAAAGEAPPERVLTPTSTAAIRRALAAASPPLKVRSQDVHPTRVEAQVCEGAACLTARLTDPAGGCPGATAGPWCVAFPEAGADAALAARVVAALATGPAEGVWVAPASTGRGEEAPPSLAPPPEAPREAPPPRSDLAAWLLALGLVLAPLAIGHAAGRLLRRAVARDAARRALIVAALPPALAAPVLVVVRWGALPLYDLLLVAFLLWAALATTAWRRRAPEGARAGRVVALVTLALALGGAELWARTLPPAGPPLPAAGALRLLFTAETFDAVCPPLYPDLYPRVMPGAPREATGAPGEAAGARPLRVLHVGDSMVRGADVAERDTFVARLGAAHRDQEHLNGGVPGTGPDFYLALLDAWLPRLRPDVVVLHLFSGNDIIELDRPYACCDGGPLLEPGGTARRCPAPRWRHDVPHLVERSPAPYPLRVLATRSALAAWLVHAQAVVARRFAPVLGLPEEGQLGSEGQWRRFERVLEALVARVREGGARPVVAVLPYRGALASDAPDDHPAREVQRRMVAAAARLGVPVLDAWPLFAGRWREHGDARDFNQAVPWDVHLSPAGHDAYARWLDERTGGFGGGSGP